MAESAGKSAFMQPKWEEPKVPSFAEAAYVKKLQDQAQKERQKELYLGALENIKPVEYVGAKIQKEQAERIDKTIKEMGTVYQEAMNKGGELTPDDLVRLNLLQTDFTGWQENTNANFQAFKDIDAVYTTDAEKGDNSVLDHEKHKEGTRLFMNSGYADASKLGLFYKPINSSAYVTNFAEKLKKGVGDPSVKSILGGKLYEEVTTHATPEQADQIVDGFLFTIHGYKEDIQRKVEEAIRNNDPIAMEILKEVDSDDNKQLNPEERKNLYIEYNRRINSPLISERTTTKISGIPQTGRAKEEKKKILGATGDIIEQKTVTVKSGDKYEDVTVDFNLNNLGGISIPKGTQFRVTGQDILTHINPKDAEETDRSLYSNVEHEWNKDMAGRVAEIENVQKITAPTYMGDDISEGELTVGEEEKAWWQKLMRLDPTQKQTSLYKGRILSRQEIEAIKKKAKEEPKGETKWKNVLKNIQEQTYARVDVKASPYYNDTYLRPWDEFEKEYKVEGGTSQTVEGKSDETTSFNPDGF